MLKSEEHTLEVLTSDLHEGKRLRRAAEKGKRESDRRADMLEKKVDELQTQLGIQNYKIRHFVGRLKRKTYLCKVKKMRLWQH